MSSNTAIEHPPQLTGYFCSFSMGGSNLLSSTMFEQVRAHIRH